MSDSEVTATTVSFDPIGNYSAKLEEITAIDEKVAKAKGTMAEWQKRSLAEAEATQLSALVEDVKAWQKEKLALLVVKDRTVGDYLTALRNEVSEAEMVATILAKEWMTANLKDGDETKALNERRSVLVAEATALANVISQFIEAGILPKETVIAEVPKAARATSGGGSTGGKKGRVSFYIVEDGERKYNDRYNASLVAWYWFGHCGSKALRDAMKAAGWSDSYGADWEGTVTATGDDGKQITRTLGFTVNSDSKDADAPAADATPDEEEAAAEAALAKAADEMVSGK